jgi:hypothetical protein
VEHQEHELAYISRGLRRSAPPIQKVDYFAGRTKKHTTVIEVKDIVRGVHLIIPKFGAQVGGTAKLQRRLELGRGQWRLQINIAVMDKARLDLMNERKWSSLAQYTEFWLNGWIKSHSYETIYGRRRDFLLPGEEMEADGAGGTGGACGGDLSEADGGRWRPKFSVVDGGSGGE